MESKGRVLVVDDEANGRSALAELLKGEGYAVETAADGFKALPKLEELGPDVVVTDLKMPGLGGLELIDKIRERDHDCVVVVMTAYGAVESAVKAMRQGAADYITKPVNIEELSLMLAREVERKRLRAEASQLRERLSQRNRIANIIGSSPAMQKVSRRSRRRRKDARMNRIRPRRQLDRRPPPSTHGHLRLS